MTKKEKNDLTEEARREAVFFDKFYSDTDERHRAENYLIPEVLVRQVTHPGAHPLIDREYACSLLGDLKGKKLLDYGAGDGWNSVCFAKARARVWAIDISEKGVELTKKKAAANGVAELVTAEVRDCYNTGYPSGMFDIIYGGGVLHHLDLDASGLELSRLLRPDGKAVFYEPVRENKIMDYVKSVVLRMTKRKPSEETEDETPLSKKRIALLKPYFKTINCREFNALSSANLLLKSEKLKKTMLHVDDVLIRYVPGFKKLCRAVVIELKDPVKNH